MRVRASLLTEAMGVSGYVAEGEGCKQQGGGGRGKGKGKYKILQFEEFASDGAHVSFGW
jgi:hypothetical protein